MDIDDFAARFQSCTLRTEEWTHPAHLIVGLWHVDRLVLRRRCSGFGAGIRRLNESFGGANTATSGYHETITAAYVTLLAQFLERGEAGGRWMTCDAVAGRSARREGRPVRVLFPRAPDVHRGQGCVGRTRPCASESRGGAQHARLIHAPLETLAPCPGTR